MAKKDVNPNLVNPSVMNPNIVNPSLVSNGKDYLDTTEKELDLAAGVDELDALLKSLDRNIANETAAKASQARRDRLNNVRAAMVRRREIMSNAGQSTAQYKFNTKLNTDNLFNK